MKRCRWSNLRVVLIAIIVCVILLSVTVQRAHAYGGAAEGLALATVISVFVTYVTAKALICTPVAALNASTNPNGFSDAFKNCWGWSPSFNQPTEDALPDSAAATHPADTDLPDEIETPAFGEDNNADEEQKDNR